MSRTVLQCKHHHLEQSSRRSCLEHGNGMDHGLDLCSCAYEETPSISLQKQTFTTATARKTRSSPLITAK